MAPVILDPLLSDCITLVSVSRDWVCDVLSMRHCTLKIFEKSRVVILVASFSYPSHRYGHATLWRSGVGDHDGCSWKK